MCVLYNVLSLAVLSVLCMGAGSRVGAAASLHPTLRSPLLKRIANSTLRVDSNSTMQMDSSASCALGPGIESHQAVQGPIWPSQAYKSSPYRPPEMYITKYNQPLSSGLIFIAPYTSAPGLTNGPLIMTDAGQLVWNGPTSQAANFRVQTYRGKNILTYWRSSTAKGPGAGRGYGEVVFLDTSYNEILTVCPNIKLLTSDGSTPACGADFHESFITPQDTILVTAVNVIAISNGFFNRRVWVYDSLFYELDPESGEVLFRWSALDHIPISQSQMPRNGRGGSQSAPYDWFHMNSVVTVGDDYLVNSRHTFSTYLINRSGDVVWTLQGQTGGDFGALPANGAFVSTAYVPCVSSPLLVCVF